MKFSEKGSIDGLTVSGTKGPGFEPQIARHENEAEGFRMNLEPSFLYIPGLTETGPAERNASTRVRGDTRADRRKGDRQAARRPARETAGSCHFTNKSNTSSVFQIVSSTGYWPAIGLYLSARPL